MSALNRIARINGRTDLSENLSMQLESTNIIEDNDQGSFNKASFCRIMKERRVLVNLIVMTWIATTVSIDYYLISFLAVTF